MLAMVQASGHDHDVLLFGVCPSQHVLQVIQVSWIAHRDDDVSRPHAQCFGRRLLVAIDPELIETLRLSLPLPRDAFLRISENHEKYSAKQDAGAGSFVLGKEI